MTDTQAMTHADTAGTHPTGLATQTGAIDGSEFLEASDIILNSLVIAQPTAIKRLQNAGFAIERGDVFNSGNEQIIVKENQLFNIMLVQKRKMWREYDKDDSTQRLGTYEWTDKNQYEEPRDPKGDKVFCVYWSILLADHLTGTTKGFPCLLPLKKTTLSLHRKMSTAAMEQMTEHETPIYGLIFEVKTVQAQSDKWDYYTFELAGTKVATPEQALKAKHWYDKLKVSEIKEAEDPKPVVATEFEDAKDDVPF